MKYLDFDVEIEQRESGYEVTAHSEAGDSSTFIRPFDEKILENYLLKLQNTLLRSVSLRRQMLSRESESVQEFGQVLFESLFSGGVRGLYEVSRTQTTQSGLGLRIRLNIRDPKLASLPWEYLYDAPRRSFVCLSKLTPLVRYTSAPQRLQSLHVDPPLRILGMIANPSDQDTLDVEREQDRMQKALAELEAQGRVKLTWLQGQTWRDLHHAFQEKDATWHIFHFIGHGGFDPRADEGVIALTNDVNKTYLLKANDLGTCLDDHPSLRLVFLNACEGARGGERDVFSSTASILAGKGLPAVLAMQYEITDHAAIEFTRAFYEALAQSLPVDTAVAAARQAVSIAISNTLEWGTPVLYLRSSDSQLFELGDIPPELKPTEAALPASRFAEHRLMSVEQVRKREQLLEKIEHYPSIIAATYAKKVVPLLDAELEQAYQFHQNLREMAESIIKYLVIVLCSRYRKDTGTSEKPDVDVEQALQGLAQPSLGGWIEVLNKTSRLYADASEQPLKKLTAFYTEKGQPGILVAKAIEKMQDWLRIEVRKRSKPPFCYRDFFELVRDYCEQPEAWGAQYAALSEKEYKERADILCLALEQTLLDLEWLASYPLISLRDKQKQVDGSWAYLLDLAIGQHVTRNAEPLIVHQPLQAGHLYLCQKADTKGFAPLLDLYPLTLCEDCPVCKGSIMFTLHHGDKERLEYHSYSCGHSFTVSSPHASHFSAYLDAASWQTIWKIDTSPPPPPENPQELYSEAVKKALEDGTIDEEERGELETLAKALGISAEQAAELEKQMGDQLKWPSAPPLDDASNSSTPTPPDEQPESPSVADLHPSPVPEVQEKLVACWNEPVASPIQVALFGSPVHALAVTEAGEVSVWSEDGRLLYREHIQGRPFRVVSLAQRVFVGTWRGQISCFGQHGLIWQTGLGSPISALAVGAGEPELVAGTWDGQIVAMRSDGTILWRTAVDDGISTVSVIPEGRAVAVGTYAGSLATFDTQGNPGWLRDMQAPVVGVAFAEHGSAIVVATQDRLVTHIHLHTQEIVWRYNVPGSPRSLLLSSSGRRLIMACGEGLILIYAIDAEIEVLKKYTIEDMTHLLLSPLSPDGHFILAVSSRTGLTFLDSRKNASTIEDQEPANCAALSPDGQYALLGHATDVSLYRLARPQLHMEFQPVGELQQGRPTRLKITLHNTGERVARSIAMQLGEVIGCTEIRLPDELDAGITATFEKQSVTPKASGALPVTSQITYMDDLGVEYTQTDLHIVDVLPGSQ